MSSRSKVILITGSTSGIGRLAAKGFLSDGYTVVIAGRSDKRIEEAVSWINPSTEAAKRLHSIIFDLESLESIRNSVEQFKSLGLQLDVLIHNAGINAHDLEHVKDTDKVEKTTFVNAVAPFYLSILFAPLMPRGRVVFVSSGIHKPELASILDPADAELVKDPNLFSLLDGKVGYEGFKYYRVSKLAMIWIAYVMAQKYSELSIITCTPGYVASTNLVSGYPLDVNQKIEAAYGPYKKTEEQCIDEYTYYATSEELNGASGQYFSNGQKDKSSERSYNMDEAVKFWNLSCEICDVPEYIQVN